MKAIFFVGILASWAPAHARPDLSIRDVAKQDPRPTRLAIERGPKKPAEERRTTRRARRRPSAAELRRSERERDTESLRFRFQLGMGIDAGLPDGCTLPSCGVNEQPATLLSGAVLDEGNLYQRLRLFTFGDAVVTTNGLLVPHLRTYFASKFRLENVPSEPSTAAPTFWDASDRALVRSAFAELTDFVPLKHLRPLTLRAGRMYHPGPVIAHFDGVTVRYRHHTFEGLVYFGQRVRLYDGLPLRGARGLIHGFEGRLHFAHWLGVPVTVDGSYLGFAGQSFGRVAATMLVSGALLASLEGRFVGDKLTRQALRARLRVKNVGKVDVEIANETDRDVLYDLFLTRPQDDPTDPRRYLSLEPLLPRLFVNLRAGTLLWRSLDLLVRGALAAEHGKGESSTFTPSYLEVGGAAGVRIRRGLRLSASATTRRYIRPTLMAIDTPGTPDVLPFSTGHFGERTFVEGGLSIRFSAGPKVFSAALETYLRSYSPQTAYMLPPPHDSSDVKAGGLLRINGWLTENLRLLLEYHVTHTSLRRAPELRALRSLRVMAESRF